MKKNNDDIKGAFAWTGLLGLFVGMGWGAYALIAGSANVRLVLASLAVTPVAGAAGNWGYSKIMAEPGDEVFRPESPSAGPVPPPPSPDEGGDAALLSLLGGFPDGRDPIQVAYAAKALRGGLTAEDMQALRALRQLDGTDDSPTLPFNLDLDLDAVDVPVQAEPSQPSPTHLSATAAVSGHRSQPASPPPGEAVEEYLFGEDPDLHRDAWIDPNDSDNDADLNVPDFLQLS